MNWAKKMNPNRKASLKPKSPEVTTERRAKYQCRTDHPRGHAWNPMTDEEVIENFEGMAAPLVRKVQMDEVRETVFKVETLADIKKTQSSDAPKEERP